MSLPGVNETGERGGEASSAGSRGAGELGLVFGVAAVLRLAIGRGVLSTVEVEAALLEAEQGVREVLVDNELVQALLPVRTLRAMVRAWPDERTPSDDTLDAFLTARSDGL